MYLHPTLIGAVVQGPRFASIKSKPPDENANSRATFTGEGAIAQVYASDLHAAHSLLYAKDTPRGKRSLN